MSTGAPSHPVLLPASLPWRACNLECPQADADGRRDAAATLAASLSPWGEGWGEGVFRQTAQPRGHGYRFKEAGPLTNRLPFRKKRSSWCAFRLMPMRTLTPQS